MTDEVRAEFRYVGIAVFVVLIAASVLLWGFPGESGKPTDEVLEPARFAWPVKPEMTAMFMGACYGAGAYFFWHVSWGGSWRAVAAYFPGIALFTALMGVSTFVHWDRFSHDHVSFFAWLTIYVVTPFLVPWLYLRNRSADPGATPGEAQVPDQVRRAVAAAGLVLLAFAAILYVTPSTVADVWPWQLTPLTGRAIAAFLVAVATTAVVLSRDERWSAWRVNVRAAAVSAALLLLATVRALDEFDGGAPGTYVFIIATIGVLGGALALDRRMRAGPLPTPASA